MKRHLILATALFSIFSTTHAGAELITLAYRGKFQSSSKLFKSGDTFFGTYTYETSGTQIDHPDSTLTWQAEVIAGRFPGTGWQLKVNSSLIGRFEMRGTAGWMSHGNNTSFGDRWIADMYSPAPGYGLPMSGMTFQFFQLDMQDPNSTGADMLSGETLSDVPDFSKRSNAGGRFFITGTTGGCDQCHFQLLGLGFPGPDADDDGAPDAEDLCPSTPLTEAADINGCSASQRDTDGDLVNDALDACPATPAGEPVDAVGCAWSQQDEDGDGVPNGKDACDATEAGASVNWSGCSAGQRDTDGDGIIDSLDPTPRLITVEFEGQFQSGSKLFNSGDTFSGSYTYDGSPAPIDHPDSTLTFQYLAIEARTDQPGLLPGTGWTLNVNSSKIAPFTTGGKLGVVSFGNDTAFGDRYIVDMMVLDSPLPLGVDLNFFQLDMQDPASTGMDMLSGEALSDLPDFSNANSAGGRFFITGDTGGCQQCQLKFTKVLGPPRDADGDGVGNALDQCPGTPAGQSVDAAGCSAAQLDSDGDGLNNDVDPDPSDPDTDDDGVPDGQDSAPTDPDQDDDGALDGEDSDDSNPDQDNDGALDGEDSDDSNPDQDNDGLLDGQDAAPNDADADDDGVIDGQDANPGDPDVDDDGVNDGADACPASAAGALVGPNGCTGEQEVDRLCSPASEDYHACVVRVAGEAKKAGLITGQEYGRIVSDRSSQGRSGGNR